MPFDPVLLSARGAIRLYIAPEVGDRALTGANVLPALSSQRLGQSAGPAFPAPAQGVSEAGAAIVVLRGERMKPIRRMHLADKGPQQGSMVRVPLIPVPAGNQRESREAVKWAEFEVQTVSSDGSTLSIIPSDHEYYPEMGGLPMLNEEDEVVGIYVNHVVDAGTRQPRFAIAHNLQDILAGLKRAKVEIAGKEQ